MNEKTKVIREAIELCNEFSLPLLKSYYGYEDAYMSKHDPRVEIAIKLHKRRLKRNRV